ncbi:MAG: tRNA lysidine(34) synthetase TilS [Ruminococcaceae bacterium]|nr:tRNA lysidine(34) synthetase TilS [Oscillospiraceae bacterium]
MTVKIARAIPPKAQLPHALCSLPTDAPVLLGFSGGADSTALLHVLLAMKETYGFPLYAAHLDHGIRGAEAARDRAFCESVAARLGIELFVGEADVPARALASGISLEEAARKERYAFFADVMKKKEIPILVTAHHADDNLETLCFRLARGTGVRGLGGIPACRPFENGFLVRPLLGVTRAELLDFCRENTIEYVTDSTNADVAYTRNRIRRDVLPVLEALYPGAAERASCLCEELHEDDAFLSSLSRELLGKCTCADALDLAKLREAPRPVRRRAITMWAEAQCGNLLHVHTEALLRLCEEEHPHMEVALPGDLIGCCERGRLYVRKKELLPHPSYRIPFAFGREAVPNTEFCVYAAQLEAKIKVHNLSTAPYIILTREFDIINKGAYWRERRAGDTILLRGMHRKLRKLQNEAKLPPRLRMRLPVLCDGEGVLWAPFVGARDTLPLKAPHDAGKGDILICFESVNT